MNSLDRMEDDQPANRELSAPAGSHFEGKKLFEEAGKEVHDEAQLNHAEARKELKHQAQEVPGKFQSK